MGVTIFESGDITNPIFGTDFPSTGKIVFAVGADETATADVIFESGLSRDGVPLLALANGNARLKQIKASTIDAGDIWVALQ